jgi:hypothetical protein
MKWFDENAYSKTNGNGVIPLLGEERRILQPGDEILLSGEGGWEPATVVSNDEGLITTPYGPVTGPVSRTKRLPKGFLCSPALTLQVFSEELLERAQMQGHPDFESTDRYAEFLLLVRMVELLKEEFPGQDVPHLPLKHRCVTDVLDQLFLMHLQLHYNSDRSTRHGMWVKYMEWNVNKLKKVSGFLKPFKHLGQLVEVVPYHSIRWVGSEEAYRAILTTFKLP